MFEWKPEYSVGIASLDGQHRNLFALGRQLAEAVNAGRNRGAVERILERLVSYTAVHFAQEERLMEQAGYPGLAEHRREHEEATREVKKLQAEFESGREVTGREIMAFLEGWLMHHIPEVDGAYEPYLRTQTG